MHRLIALGLLSTALACGSRPPQIGIRLNQLAMTKTRVGDSPQDVATLQRPYEADVLGDETPEVIAALDDGRGIEIRDRSGTGLARIPTTDYLTDFGAVPDPASGKHNLVLYLYPNATNGGTFRIVTAGQREVAAWEENPPPGRFAVAAWRTAPALFYLQNDTLIVRSAAGQPLARLEAPDGRHFQRLHVRNVSGGRTVVLASGSGYTPYHMVCVYDEDGRLLFQDVADEHAFELASRADDSTFVVVTRSSRWEYRPR
jgi:hypothetical protein